MTNELKTTISVTVVFVAVFLTLVASVRAACWLVGGVVGDGIIAALVFGVIGATVITGFYSDAVARRLTR